MEFQWPTMLALLALLPAGVVFYLRLLQRRRQALARFGGSGWALSDGGRLGFRRHIPPAILLLGLTIVLLALARPQAAVSLPRVEGTIILAFDVSGSMAATDLEPTRMEAAKVVARDFVQRQPRSVRIGVVAFSESGLAVQAPTTDQAALLGAIERITPQRGTSLGQGIQAALHALEANQPEASRRYSTLPATPTPTPAPVPPGSNRGSAIVLLSDGENTAAPHPLDAAQAAADRGVRVYTVGVGSATGTTLEVNGFSVHTQLDEAMLQEIARRTGGAYRAATSEAELRAIYDDLDLELVVRPEATEITAVLAGLGLLVLLLGGSCSLLWFGRVP